MILLVLASAVAALIAYALTKRLSAAKRTWLALLVFLAPPIAVVATVIAVGDRAPPDAVTVDLGN